MRRFRLTWIVCLALLAPGLLATRFAHAQDAKGETAVEETPEEARERVTVERFLQLLKRRPRLGTALDRVYGYHVGRGTLDEFAQSLEDEAKQTDEGTLWLVLGMVQMQRGNDAQAVAALEKAEEALPEEPLASYYLGKTLVLLGEIDKAADAMRRAIERKPARADMLAIFQDLGRIYQRTGRNQEALDVWKQLEELFPGDNQVREQIASVLAEEGATEAALERYQALATSVKDRFRKVELAIRAAQLTAQLGKTDEALGAFEEQLALVNPDSWLHRDIRRRIEEVFWSSGDIDGLVDYYTHWVKEHPDDVDAMMRTARVLAAQRRMPEAEKWFRDAIAKAPSTAEPRLALVEALATNDRFADAAKEMGELVELQPDNPDYIVRWGELVFNDSQRSEEDRRREAGQIWRRMLEKRGDDPVTVARVADLLRASGASDQAIEQYGAAIELAPGDPQYREYLGEFLHQLGRKDEALATWRELASGDRRTRDNLVRLSEVLSTFRYDEEALETIAAACEMKPTFGHRARHAELLREAKRYDEALAELDRAEPLAEDPELRELIVEERIKNYQASGELQDRIDETEDAVAGEAADDPAAWRLLALLRDADRKFQLACEAVDKATELAPNDVMTWETAATLHERAGHFGDAVAAYRKLATLDRRYLSHYLTQIASLEMRLGNAEAALETGEELIAAAPGNSEHYRFFADLCFRVGNSERAFDVLRRNVRANPNERDALTYLAGQLAEDFQTDEAIELYWRAFDQATNIDEKKEVIAPLTELYLRSNRFETLIDRLDVIGREENKPRDAILWVAEAHQAAGDLGKAKQLLEQLAREDSRDTKLLEQLVALARAEYDFESAADYQRRIVAAAPTPEAEYLLANLLLELGDIDEAEAAWLKLSQRGGHAQALTASIYTLLGKEQYETAAKVLERAMAKDPGNWEILGPAMLAYVQLDRDDDAREVAKRVLAMNVEPGEPTEEVAEAIKKRSRRGSRTSTYDPYATLGQPVRTLQAIQLIQQAMGVNQNNYSSRRSVPKPLCFGDVRVMASCMPLLAAEQGADTQRMVKAKVDSALESKDVDELWQALSYVLWINPRAAYSYDSDDDYQKLLEALVAQEDPHAASQLLARKVNQRRTQARSGQSKLAPLEPDEIKEFKRLGNLAARANPGTPNYTDLYLAADLSRSGAVEEAAALLDRYLEQASTFSRGSVAALQAVNVLLADNYQEPPTSQMIDKALELFHAGLADTSLSGSSGANTGHLLATLVEQLVKLGRRQDALQVVDDVLQWQAEQVTTLRPSQRRRFRSSTPLSFGRSVNGRYVRSNVEFPPVSPVFGAEAILAVFGLHEACKDDPKQLAEVSKAVAERADESTDDPYLKLARRLAGASMAYWSDDHQQAQKVLADIDAARVDAQPLALMKSRLLYESGDVPGALAIIETLRPTNQQMLVDRELTILQLVLQRGDLERAKASAQKLFALRLDSDTELKLADLMYQLGMRELGDRMMGRLRRRAGGKQDTLVQLMNRYASSGDPEEAAEIARQVVRRTSPRATSNSYTAENQQHEQAVRVLAQTGALDELIERYEGLVERSPKSKKLADKLCAFYEAAGRRSDAEELRLKAVDSVPHDPRSLYQAGLQLTRLEKHDEAVEKFIEAVIKSPDLLNNNYYNMRTSFEKAKAWARFSDALVDNGLGKIQQSYRLGEIMRELGQANENEALNRLLYASLSELDWSQVSQSLYPFSSLNVKPEEKLVKLVTEKLTDEDADFSNLTNTAFVRSRSSQGQTSGFVDGIAEIVAADDALRKDVSQAMRKRLKKSDDELFARVLLALVLTDQKEFDEVEATMQPLLDKEKKENADGQAVWCVASALTHRSKNPGLGAKLLEGFGSDNLPERNSDFEYTAASLLAYAYERSGRKADAHRILIEELKNAEINEQYANNPGYGEYQYIGSLCSLAERFLKMDYPAEAFLAYRKAYSDETMLDRAVKWGGTYQKTRRDRLREQITQQQDAGTISRLVKATLDDSQDVDDATTTAVAFLTEPQVERNSLMDTQVTMPLAEFTSAIGENKKMREAVSKVLDDLPPPDAQASLRSLVTRLMISDAVKDEEQAKSSAQAILAWTDAHAANAAGSTDSAADEPETAEDPKEESKTDAKPEKKQAEPLNDELLLGMAAARMPAEVPPGDVVKLLERASAAAEAEKQTALVGSLRCQIAKRIADDEPDRARQMFRAALDELLPPADEQASANNEKETD
ncbi:MAG: hypothetical protein DWQ37_16100 [Planctomycetota bacterium]|nr:MAG: hypothetical protein DWQ37_16100 [Planctomycetota bacterium]